MKEISDKRQKKQLLTLMRSWNAIAALLTYFQISSQWGGRLSESWGRRWRPSWSQVLAPFGTIIKWQLSLWQHYNSLTAHFTFDCLSPSTRNSPSWPGLMPLEYEERKTERFCRYSRQDKVWKGNNLSSMWKTFFIRIVQQKGGGFQSHFQFQEKLSGFVGVGKKLAEELRK